MTSEWLLVQPILALVLEWIGFETWPGEYQLFSFKVDKL